MSLLSRLLPTPGRSAILLVIWLMLNVTVSLGHIIFGSVFAIAIPLLCAPLQISQPRIKKPLKALKYFFMVLGDVVVANVQVAILVLGPISRIKPGFVAVPLDIKEIRPITILASTVTMTPGTVTAELSKDKRYLYVHVLQMPDDEQEVIRFIKDRYESAIKEMFQC
ncbi:Na+/H+ antiporter subunit E [Alteromonas sp. BMJM2]|uniref:Na+/H+ antiporter subunit E n=1 Tax=Alteromonas sp. BMJM2 TaxID=2954241 RepID=UPI0022B45691|nr:Na+/H+ antiporter subunit E [Alteromonas sp. BMJM2]